MKSISLFSFFLLLTFQITYSQISAKQIPAQQPARLKAAFLLKTNWDQWGTYARYTPDNQVLGCWSTALSQILYYYRLKPFGTVSYTCSKGYIIKDTLSAYQLSWNDFRTSIEDNSAPKAIDAVARYSYLTALAIRKDFGTSKYLEMINPAPLIARHFDCKATFYASFTGNIPFSEEQMKLIAEKEQIQHVIDKAQIKLLIKNEIGHRRPVYFHMGNFTSYGHSTVIDGYFERKNTFYVHINYGAGGFRTGWYDLFKSIDVEDDIRLRAFITIEPINKR